MKTFIVKITVLLSLILWGVVPVLAQTMAFGQSLRINMRAYDNARIHFQGNSGDVVTIHVAGSCVNGENLDPNFSVDAPDGSFVRHDENSGGGCAGVDAAMSITLPQDGTYTIRLYNRDAAGVAEVSINCPNLNCFGPVNPPVPLPPSNDGSMIQSVSVPDRGFVPNDERINRHFKDQAAPVAIYCHSWGIQVRSIDPVTGRGADPADIDLTNEQLALIPIPADENLLVVATDTIQFSRLTTGEFQVNAQEANGKEYVFIWNQCDPTLSYHLQADLPYTLDYASLHAGQ